jgi:carbonic anhydrase
MRRKALWLVVMLFLLAVAAPVWAAGGGAPQMSPDEALKMLKEGNDRYVTDKSQHPNQSRERRGLTAGQGQHPFAAVLSCADSRAPVELIFDRGIGDLFVVRVAGNVAGPDEVGSLEYAVDHSGTPLVVVLGHSQCGVVTAVVQNEKVPANVAALVKPIAPAVAQARADNPGAGADALIDAAIKANIRQAMEDLLQKSPIIKGRVKAGKLKVLGALYELDTGQVQWLGPHPAQDKLVGVTGKGAGAKGKKGEGKKPRQEE